MMRERFLTTLTRSAALAAALGVVLYLVLPRQVGGWWAFLDAFSLAFCFTFLATTAEWSSSTYPAFKRASGGEAASPGGFEAVRGAMPTGRSPGLSNGSGTVDLPLAAL